MIKKYSGNMLSGPELIAKTVRKAVTNRRPCTRYLIGFGAKPMVWTHKILGDRVFDRVIKNYRATPHNLARSPSLDFWLNSKFGKRRNTVCISRFSY